MNVFVNNLIFSFFPFLLFFQGFFFPLEAHHEFILTLHDNYKKFYNAVEQITLTLLSKTCRHNKENHPL